MSVPNHTDVLLIPNVTILLSMLFNESFFVSSFTAYKSNVELVFNRPVSLRSKIELQNL